HPITTYLYTLSLHVALPISAEQLVTPSVRDPTVSWRACRVASALCGIGAVANNPCRGRSWSRGLPSEPVQEPPPPQETIDHGDVDRKSTRLNSSHEWISYAV